MAQGEGQIGLRREVRRSQRGKDNGSGFTVNGKEKEAELLVQKRQRSRKNPGTKGSDIGFERRTERKEEGDAGHLKRKRVRSLSPKD